LEFWGGSCSLWTINPTWARMNQHPLAHHPLNAHLWFNWDEFQQLNQHLISPWSPIIPLQFIHAFQNCSYIHWISFVNFQWMNITWTSHSQVFVDEISRMNDKFPWMMKFTWWNKVQIH
jgi:hypothetical protein